MCGIAGTVQVDDKAVLARMLRSLEHRGPDDEGTYYDEKKKVFLGHRRLSILDLSSAGHQPMSDPERTIQVVFNGEIYNYKTLRKELEELGYAFASESDTEVLVHGYDAFGEDLFKKLDGMWAIALYDARKGTLVLSRDPAGIKPLFVYRAGGTCLFASELGALADVLRSEVSTSAQALRRYLSHGYVYGDGSMYDEIASLAPGTTQTYAVEDMRRLADEKYVPARMSAPRTMREALDTFETLFRTSVEESLQSDVPVSTFLSSGVDSSLLSSAIHKSGASLQSFTVGFAENSFDESQTAARIARHCGFPHETFVMRGSDVAGDIAAILDSFGEPFADMAALPMYYLCKRVRERGYKVALAGDGADELFGGYQTHFLPRIARWYRAAPSAADALIGNAAAALPVRMDKLGTKERLERFLLGARQSHQSAHALWKRIFRERELDRLLLPEARSRLAGSDDSFGEFFAALDPKADPAQQVMDVDFMTFLPSSCLVKADICSMRHGLEVRVPFLNKAMIEFARSLPVAMKVSPFRTKKLLREALARSMPPEIARLPKQGFVPPLGRWLAGDLREAMLRILSKEEVAKAALFDYTYISQLIEDHLERTADNTKQLWCLMSAVRFFSNHGHTLLDRHSGV